MVRNTPQTIAQLETPQQCLHHAPSSTDHPELQQLAQMSAEEQAEIQQLTNQLQEFKGRLQTGQDFTTSQRFADLTKEIQTVSYDALTADPFKLHRDILLETHHANSAERLLQRALHATVRADSSSRQVRISTSLRYATAYELKHSTRARELHRELRSAYARAGKTSELGIDVWKAPDVYAVSRGQLREALQWFQKYLHDVQSVVHPSDPRYASSYINIAYTQIALGCPLQARETLLQALRVINNYNEGEHQYLSLIHYNLAVANQSLGEFEESTYHSQQSFEQCRKTNRDPLECNSTGGIRLTRVAIVNCRVSHR